MTKHRTITGFVAVALVTVAATAATMRSGPTIDPHKLPTANFDDRWSAMSTVPPTTEMAERLGN